MNFSFQALVILAMCVQKGLSEGIDISGLLEKMEFFLNDEGKLEVFNTEDYQLDFDSILEDGSEDEKQIDLFDNGF